MERAVLERRGMFLKSVALQKECNLTLTSAPKPLGVAEDGNIWQSRERNQVVCEELAHSSEKSCSFYLL